MQGSSADQPQVEGTGLGVGEWGMGYFPIGGFWLKTPHRDGTRFLSWVGNGAIGLSLRGRGGGGRGGKCCGFNSAQDREIV